MKYITLILLFICSISFGQGECIGEVRGLLTQYSTEAPTLIIFENTTGVEIETVYNGVGDYALVFPKFTFDNTHVWIDIPRTIADPSGSRWNYQYDYIAGAYEHADWIGFISKKYDYGTTNQKVFANSLYNGTPFHIKIYSYFN